MTRATAKIPVLVCTAAVGEVRQNEGHLKAMGVEVILKPFDIDVFLRTVKEALASRGLAPSYDEANGSDSSDGAPTGDS